jgi:hypothetical protein
LWLICGKNTTNPALRQVTKIVVDMVVGCWHNDFTETETKRYEMTKYADFDKKYSFSNGYGASVVRNEMSYGNKSGLFELAVLKDDKLCYDTPITGNVIGWLYWNEVESYLDEINRLPKILVDNISQ